MFPPGSNTGDPREPWANGYVSPGNTVPFPTPDAKYRPVGYWESEPATIAWQSRTAVPGQTNVTVTGSWGTPIFDLRPDVMTASSRQNRASPINRIAGTQIFFAVSGLTTGSHVGMEVYLRYLGHPVDPLKAFPIQPDTNVTADLSTGLDTAVVNVIPFSGYPMRFFAAVLRFDFTSVVPASLPVITVQAGAY